MKKYLNTLYVTTQNAYLKKQRETLVARIENKDVLSLPIHTLDGIVCFGAVSMSPYLMHHCAQNNVSVSFLSEYGKFLARVQGPVSGNVLLRRQQYRIADSEESSGAIARNFLIGKLANCRTVSSRGLRDHGENTESDLLTNAKKRLGIYLKTLERGGVSMSQMRGDEGDAASCYFSAFPSLITVNDDAFKFTKRTRRPPMDAVNAMLSFAYTLLAHDCQSALEGVGLDPYVGFLHVDRPGRASLALDLMEEFRPFLADRLVLSLINRRQLQSSDFIRSNGGAVTMKDDARKIFLDAWQKRKIDTITHPYLGEKCPVGLVSHLQAQLLARHIRGDMDAYPPFIWRS